MRKLVLLGVTGFLLAGCGGGGGGTTPTATTTSGTSAQADTHGCMPAQGVSQAARTAKEPTAKLDPGKTYDVTLVTNCGSFTIRMDQAQSPNATASFVALARTGFFDHTIFHRIVPGFVIQGGDPTGTGTGGPGYSTVDPPPSTPKYTHGVVAMAKMAAEAPGTAGGQFVVL